MPNPQFGQFLKRSNIKLPGRPEDRVDDHRIVSLVERNIFPTWTQVQSPVEKVIIRVYNPATPPNTKFTTRSKPLRTFRNMIDR